VKARGRNAGRAPILVALAAALLGGCQLVSGLAGVEVASTTGTGGAGGAAPIFPCTPDPATCPEVASPCIALGAAASGPSTLRIAQLDLVKPAGLYGTGVKSFLYAGVTLDLPRCKLAGLGTFSWLLRFDTDAKLLRTGASRPADDPLAGYSFVDEMIDSGGGPLKVAPIEMPLSFVGASGSFTAQNGPDGYLPLYFDPGGTQVVILPLRALRITGTLSQDRRCIGAYDPQNLSLSDDCVGDRDHHGYVNGGTIDGYLLLEEADTLVAGPFGQSLCVLLSGDADKYGDGASPVAHCARDASGKIVFEGDWCSITNVEGKCRDAMQLLTSFAASAVPLVP
jgi:hypothetical protein